MNKCNSATTLKMGRGVGQIEGVLGALGIGYYEVSPRGWQSRFHDSKDKRKAKEKTLDAFLKIYPDMEKAVMAMTKAKREAIVDAAMIGRWGWEILREKGVEGLGVLRGLS